MARKIPKHGEIKARIQERKIEEQKIEQEKIKRFLYDKCLVMYFHSALAVEAHDLLKPTTVYNKGFKRDGNRFLAHLERVANENFDRLYKGDPEFTTNMFAKIEQVVNLIAMVDFGDYPILAELLVEFHNDKENWKKNVVSTFNRLDADLTGEPEVKNYQAE